MKTGSMGDIQSVDVGIGAAHFELVADDLGINGEFKMNDPGIPMPENTSYMISYKLK